MSRIPPKKHPKKSSPEANATYDCDQLPKDLVDHMVKNRGVRIGATCKSFFLFFHFYFAHYVHYPTALFQKELFNLAEEESVQNLFVVAFRGSGKSTIFTTAYPIWAILGKQQKKFVLLLCQTQAQAKQHMMNLRRELENNALLKSDLGPFKEESDEWGSASLVFSKSGARITAASSEQSIRGLRHNQHRPDLIIGDDVEDIASTKTRESRNKTYQWMTGEVVPAGDRKTRLVIVGNLLHEDSLLMRIKEDIEADKTTGTFKEYPLIERGKVLWPGKYPTEKDLEDEKKKTGNEIAWEREYMLRIVSDEDQPIDRKWIQYYDVLPSLEKNDHRGVRIGIDLAISKKDTADYTSMVTGAVFGDGKDLRVYILPDIINKRLNFAETVDMCKVLNEKHRNGHHRKFVIEEVGYQSSLIQHLENEGLYDVVGVRPGTDKRSRLSLTAYLIREGRVLFPRGEASKALVSQIVNFGVEKHDDLADAFSILMLDIIDNPPFFVGVA